MSIRGFTVASPAPGSGGGWPLTVEKPLASGYAANIGALLLVNASDQYAECGADPALIAAVAISAGGTDSSGFSMLGKKEFPPGYMQAVAVQDGRKFLAPFVDSLPANAGGSYGVIRDTDGMWKVDFAETVNVRVIYHKVVDFRPDLAAASESLVECSVLAANVQRI